MPQPLDPTGIRAIIFDIGNVLIDIDYDVMVAEFKKIAKYDFREIINYTHQESFFDLFEKGKITVPGFHNTLRKYLAEGISDEEIVHAWNSILVSYPSQKFELLQRLRIKYKIYALSNINALHLEGIDNYMTAAFGVDMRSYFDHAYYSHEMGLRKPETEIYQAVITNAGLDPAHTLFIDDKSENTEAAAALGMHVYHLINRDSLLEILSLF
ncbi:MAG: HAD-superfamily hydrolase, subfamily variant 3 [Bacteroidetes bacterium]|nr:HAD-superfamily hydrolase, subfamily variant 3 [Bacteroidota bacterium]